jgi:DNA polymerase I-like protein with 3'-5' exonuclease and polymerase domains
MKTSMKDMTPLWERILSNPIILDLETTISNEGNVHDITNKIVTIQIHTLNTNDSLVFTKFTNLNLNPLNKASILIGANLKFDLGWLRKKLGYVCSVPIWDIQLAEFFFSNQRWPYPDLDTMGENYGVGHKIDNIKLNYWDKGIDTDLIPIEELKEYGIEDCKLTAKIFQKQVKRFQTTDKGKFLLFRLYCNDELVLQEMEHNGLVYDEQSSLEKVKDYEQRILEIDLELNKLFDSPVQLNYGSTDDVSIALYGGTKKIETRICIGQYKTGLKEGRDRYKILKSTIDFSRLVEPVKGSALKKEGFYSTDEPTLLSLKPTPKIKKIITLLLERSKCKKIIGTYLKGLPKLREEMNWPPGWLYPSYNQCQANTGRLSSSKPNAQNQTPESKEFFISRYS